MFCTNCGAKLSDEAKFCVSCGAKLAAPEVTPQPVTQQHVQQAPVPQEAYQPPAYQQAPAYATASYAPATHLKPVPAPIQGTALAANPLRAIILAGAVFITILFGAFFAAGRGAVESSYLYILFLVLVACGSYLALQREALYKVAAGVLALVAPLTFSFVSTMVMASNYSMATTYTNVPGLSMFFDAFEPINFIIQLVTAILVIGTAFAVSLLIKSEPKKQTLLATLICSGAFLAVSFLLYVILFRGFNPIYFLLLGIISNIPDALALGLAILLVSLFCTMKSFTLKVGLGPRIWFIVCLFFTSLSYVVTTAMGYELSSSYLQLPTLMLTILTSLGIVGYALLVGSKRTGYLLLLLGIGVLFFGQFNSNFSYLLQGFVYGAPSGNSASLGIGLVSSLSVLVNPTITSIVLLRAWKIVPDQVPYEKPRVALIFKIASIVAIVSGFILFFVGSVVFFGIGGYREVSAFFFGTLLGGATCVVGLFAALACFRKQSRASKPLLIISLVLAAFALAFWLFLGITFLISLV
jgi:hypothetical protein